MYQNFKKTQGTGYPGKKIIYGVSVTLFLLLLSSIFFILRTPTYTLLGIATAVVALVPAAMIIACLYTENRNRQKYNMQKEDHFPKSDDNYSDTHTHKL